MQTSTSVLWKQMTVTKMLGVTILQEFSLVHVMMDMKEMVEPVTASLRY